jgi:hypothetical protein
VVVGFGDVLSAGSSTLVSLCWTHSFFSSMVRDFSPLRSDFCASFVLVCLVRCLALGLPFWFSGYGVTDLQLDGRERWYLVH